MDKVKLVSKGITLTLVAESNWQCHVYFSDHNKYNHHYLGVAQVEYVCLKLISGISTTSMADKDTFKHEGLDLFWIMSLFVGHAGVYGNVSNEGFRLFCQDDGGPYLPIITLDQQCIKDWITQLSKLRLKYQSES
jgi:hypothetical protein